MKKKKEEKLISTILTMHEWQMDEKRANVNQWQFAISSEVLQIILAIISGMRSKDLRHAIKISAIREDIESVKNAS